MSGKAWRLEKQSRLITWRGGGASAKAWAKRFAEEGAKVVVADSTPRRRTRRCRDRRRRDLDPDGFRSVPNSTRWSMRHAPVLGTLMCSTCGYTISSNSERGETSVWSPDRGVADLGSDAFGALGVEVGDDEPLHPLRQSAWPCFAEARRRARVDDGDSCFPDACFSRS